MNSMPLPRKPLGRSPSPTPSKKMSDAERKKAVKQALQQCNQKYGRMLRRLAD